MIIDETKRLIIREIEEAEVTEASRLFTMFNENEIKVFTEDMVRAYIDVAYGFYGYGYYGLFEKTTGDFIGLCGFREGSCPLEIGYCIREDKRNLGYATEAVKSMTEWAEEDFLWVLNEDKRGEKITADALLVYEKEGKVLVYGRTDRCNKASIEVLRKNGFKECEGFEA